MIDFGLLHLSDADASLWLSVLKELYFNLQQQHGSRVLGWEKWRLVQLLGPQTAEENSVCDDAESHARNVMHEATRTCRIMELVESTHSWVLTLTSQQQEVCRGSYTATAFARQIHVEFPVPSM